MLFSTRGCSGELEVMDDCCFRQRGCSGELEVMDDHPSTKPFPARELLLLIQLRPYRKLMQILNDPKYPMRHCFDSRHSNRSGRFLLPRMYIYIYIQTL